MSHQPLPAPDVSAIREVLAAAFAGRHHPAIPTIEQQQANREAEHERRFPAVVITGETLYAYRLSRPGSMRDVWISKQGVTLNHVMLPLPYEKREDRPDGRRVWYPCVRASFAPWARRKFLANT